jgi:hypothetical protein
MAQVAQLADEVRSQRRPAARDNPLVQWQAAASEAIVSTLNGWRDIHNTLMEQTFLMIYGSPALQAMVGLRASDASPRRRPGNEPERIAFVEQRIGELRARIAQGDGREAAVRCLCYIGMGGPGVDERVFNQVAHLRSRYGEIPLEQFKCVVRDQYFSLLLDEEAALAAVPSMLPDDVQARARLLEDIRLTVSAAGSPDEEQWRRMARVEALFSVPTGASTASNRNRKSSRER